MARRIPLVAGTKMIMRFDDEDLGAFTPLDIPNCQLWLDAQDSSTFNAGSPSDGDALTLWADKSGQGNDLDVVTAGTPRYYNASRLINGLPVASFDGSTRFRTTTNFSLGNYSSRGYSILVMARMAGSTRARLISSQNYNWLFGWWGGGNEKYYAEGWVSNQNDGLIAQLLPQIPCGVSRSSSYTDFYWNANRLVHKSPAAKFPVRIGQLSLGGSGVYGENSDGVVGETLIYDRSLTYDESWTLIEYLRKKWGSAYFRNVGGNAEIRGYNYGVTMTDVTDMPFTRAGLFNGSDTYVQIPYTSQIGTDLYPTSQITIEGWVKFNSLSGLQALATSWHGSGGNGPLIYFDFDYATPRMTWAIDTGAPDILRLNNIDAIFNTTDWFHIACTYDGTTMRIFINGGEWRAEQGASGSLVYSHYPYEIGRYYNNETAADSMYFDGLIAEIGISDRAKPVSELYSTYQAGTDPQRPFEVEVDSNIVMNFDDDDGIVRDEVPGGSVVDPQLLVHCKMNDNAATTVVVDSSGNGHNGTALRDTDIMSTPGIINTALKFAGATDRVDFGTGTAFDLERTDSFSVACWFRADTNTNNFILGKREGASVYRGYQFYIDTSQRLVVTLINTWTSNVIYCYGGTNLNNGAWYHLAMTYDGSSSVDGVHLYVNGAEVSKTVGYDSLSGTIINSAPMIIGGSNGLGYNLSGDLDDCRLYLSELNAVQIKELFGRGRGTENDLPTTKNNHDGIPVGNVRPVIHYGIGDSGGAARTWYFPNTLTDYIEIPNHADFNNANQEMTFEFWVNMQTVSRHRFMHKHILSPPTPAVPVPIIECNSTAKLNILGPIDTSSRRVTLLVDSNIFLFVAGDWAYIAVTWDPVTKEMVAYANGSPVASGTEPTMDPTDCDNTAPLFLGGAAAAGYPMYGHIGGFRYTLRKKTALEIYNYYKGASIQAY